MTIESVTSVLLPSKRNSNDNHRQANDAGKDKKFVLEKKSYT